MLPLWFSSWVYSSGNCIFSLARLSTHDAQHVHHKSPLCLPWSRLQRVREGAEQIWCLHLHFHFRMETCDPSQIVAFSVLYLFEYGQRHGFLMLWCHVCMWRKIINHSSVSHHVWLFLNNREEQLLNSNLKILESSLDKYNSLRDQIFYDLSNYVLGITYYLEICTIYTSRDFCLI